MVTQIINGISMQLSKGFGDDFSIYDKNTGQELKKPCFLIKPLIVRNMFFCGNRKKRDFSFDIQFFTANDEVIMEVGEKMADALEFIELLNGDCVHGKDISFEVIDEVLHFYITYGTFLNEIKDENSMEAMISEVKNEKK